MRKLADITVLIRLVLLVITASSFRIWAAASREARGEAGELRSLERQHAEVERKLSLQPPVAVRKMSDDPSEMFFPEYWHFELELDQDPASKEEVCHTKNVSDSTADTERNGSKPYTFIPPLIPHYDSSSPISVDSRSSRRNVFEKRDYKCPGGYHNCDSIGFHDACCAHGEQCQLISNTGVGVIGCCPRGTKCRGSISSCDESQGYSSCPNRRNPNGCCAPGFVCDAIGCVRRQDATTIVTPTQTIVGTTTRTLVSTTIVSSIGPSTVYTTTTYPTSTRTVGPVVQSDTKITTRTITSVAPPVQPTGSAGYCPTGFYRCSAFYVGGCCRVGRDCRSTNCPLLVTAEETANGVVTVVIATGEGVVTIVQGGGIVPTNRPTVSAGTTTVSTSDQDQGDGSCAEGWYNCGVAGGGGCCPSGYSCSTKCVATQSGLPDTALKAPVDNRAPDIEGWGGWLVAFAGVVVLAAVWL